MEQIGGGHVSRDDHTGPPIRDSSRCQPTWLLVCAVVTWSLGEFLLPRAISVLVVHLCLDRSLLEQSDLLFSAWLPMSWGTRFSPRELGIPVRSISFFLFGGVTQFKRESPLRGMELVIALIGPALMWRLAWLLLLRVALLRHPEVVSALLLWAAP